MVAWQGVKADAVKSALLILTLTLGMLGFVSVIAAERVLLDSVSQRALLTGGPSATYLVATSNPVDVGELEHYTAQLGNRIGATASSLTISNQDVQLWVDDQPNLEIGIEFVSHSLIELRPLVLLAGGWFDAVDTLAPSMVVNRLAAKELRSSQSLQLGSVWSRQRANVIGVVEDGAFEPRAYLAVGDAPLWPTENASFALLFTAPHLTEELLTESARHLSDFGSSIQVSDLVRLDTIDRLSNELAATTRVLLVLGFLSLAATTLAIANMGLATARARAREYDLRQAFGASRVQIASITMLESQMLALIAALFATALSYAIYPLVVSVFDAPSGVQPPGYSLDYAVLCLVVASATALISSIAPALLSFRKDISDVMRQ